MIDGVDFHNLEAQRYWTFPAGYKKDAKKETQEMIFSGDYIGARKVDGAFYKFFKDSDGKMELLGRSKSVNGDYLNKIDWVPQLHPFFNSLPNGTCLLGEIYLPENEGSHNVTAIMGCLVDKALKRQETGMKLHYYVFDILAYNGESLYEEFIQKRLLYLNKIEFMPYTIKAVYYEGKELWEELQQILSNDGEGIVITKKGTCYQPGKRPARQTLKVKKELQEKVDCFFTGHIAEPTRAYTGKEIQTWKYWENLKTGEKIEGEFYKEYSKGDTIEPVTKPYFYGWAGSLEIALLKGEKIIPIGFLSGLTDEIKANYKNYRGKCIEVTAMQFTEDGMLRHGKFVQFREDLNIKDCTWEKVYGK